MGSTSQTRREREMFLIVLLLISTAFGRPNSAQLQRSSVISDDLEAAELDILELEAGLSNLQALVPLLSYVEGSYVAKFEGAKSYLQQARQELRDLADTTVRESRDMILLLEDYDRNNDPDLLEITIDIMKDLMLETSFQRLEEVLKKYYSAREAFDNLYQSVEIHNKLLDAHVDHLDDYDVPSENFWAKQADFKSKSDSFLRSVDSLNEMMAVNIDLIYTWAISNEARREEIESFPAEYIIANRINREIFKTGLLDMKNFAEQFLA